MKRNKHNEKGKLYWWTNFAPPAMLQRRRTRKYARLYDSLHMTRDGAAALYAASVLFPLFDFGGLLLNLPRDVFAESGPPFSNFPKLLSEDLILVTNRPPLTDDSKYDKKFLRKSGSLLEIALLKSFNRFFKNCSRYNIILSDDVVAQIDTKDPNIIFRAVKFNVKDDSKKILKSGFHSKRGNISSPAKWGRVGRPETPTMIGYFVYDPEVNWDEKPAVAAVFSSSGTATLLFSKLLFTEQSELIKQIISENRPRIILGEFSPEFPENRRPTDLSFKSNQSLNILIDVTLTSLK